MGHEYTPEQAAEIAGYLDSYLRVQETAHDLRSLYSRCKRSPRLKPEAEEMAFALKGYICKLKETVPQSVRDNVLWGETPDHLESLANDTLLNLRK